MKDFRFRSLYYSKKKIQNANHVLVTIEKHTTHKNNLIPIYLRIGFFCISYMLRSEVSNVLLLSEVKGKKAFSITRAQACLLTEVIKLTLAYLTKSKFIIKIIQRIIGRAQNKTRITLKMIPSPKLILFVYLMKVMRII